MTQLDGTFDIGDEVTVEGRFTERGSGDPIDPADVVCTLLRPGETEAEEVAAAGEDGVYTGVFTATSAGDHAIRMQGAPPAQVVTEIVITVRPRRVPELA